MVISMNLYRDVTECPWCRHTEGIQLYGLKQGGFTIRCAKCGLVYATRVLSDEGIKIYWSDYESAVHTLDREKAEQRRKMYRIDYGFISPFLAPKSRVLDIGCSNGDFLDVFAEDGHICEGVEFGKEAYELASKKYHVYFGNLSELSIPSKYNLIVFRGVVQYLLEPKKDLKKAIDLLADEGILYITASPNSESICFKLFLDHFSLPVTETDYYMYSENVLTAFMQENGMELMAKAQLYLETPYANPEDDIIRIAKAINLKSIQQQIDFQSPAFFDNMLTLAYKKVAISEYN